MAGDGAGTLTDFCVDWVVQVFVRFDSIFDKQTEPDFVGVVGAAADPFEGESGGSKGICIFVKD